jgi:hypothetical protein
MGEWDEIEAQGGRGEAPERILIFAKFSADFRNSVCRADSPPSRGPGECNCDGWLIRSIPGSAESGDAARQRIAPIHDVWRECYSPCAAS